MNNYKLILLALFSIVLLISLGGAVAEYLKHKRFKRFLLEAIGLGALYGTIIYLAYNG